MNAQPPLVMGIVNVTPDSFSDGGDFLDVDAAVAHALRLVKEGAGIVDIGGESTRPGADYVDVDEEIARVVPVIKLLTDELQNTNVRISVDTRKEEVARAALQAGAQILNDVSSTLVDVAQEFNVPWIAMHMQGEPQTMQAKQTYKNVVNDVRNFLATKIKLAKQKGVEIWIDPGIGFGKTFTNNIDLIANITELVESGVPVVMGASRKSFIKEITGEEVAAQRDDASLAVALWSITQGVRVLRVHNVAATVNALKTWNVIDQQKLGSN